MQQLPVRIVERQFYGYNDLLPPQEIPAGFFAKADNVLVSDNKISKVPGTTAIAPSVVSQAAQGLAVFENYTSASKSIVAVYNGASNASWYQWSGSGSFSAIASSNVLANNTPFFFEQAANKLFGVNGTEVGDWDGTTFTHNRTGFPKGRYLTWFHNYLFVGNVASFPSRLFWSALGDPTLFDGSILGITINSGGVGYNVGDVLAILGGNGVQATVSVTTVSSGVITAISLLTAGSGYVAGSASKTTYVSTASTNLNTGSGATIDITVNAGTAQNFVDINAGDSDQIMGLGAIQDQLVVFKRETIWSVTGFSGSTFSAATAAATNTNNRIIGYGCIAPGSIVSTGNDIYFMSFLGDVPHIRSLKITQYATTLGGGIITHDITGTMKTINLNALSAVQGIYDGRYIRWALPTGSSTTPNMEIILDTYNITVIKKITRYPFTSRSGINPTYYTTSTISGSSKVYFTDTGTSGLVFKVDSAASSDNGNSITMDVITRGYLPDPARKQKWKYLKAKFDTGNAAHLYISANVDNQGSILQSRVYLGAPLAGLDTFILDMNTLGGGTTDHATVPLAKLTGYMIQHEFFESSTLAQTLYEFETYALSKPLRSSNNAFQSI